MVLMAVTWLLLGLIIGAVGFFSAGFVASIISGSDMRDRVGAWYIDMAMTSIGDAAMTVRETGALEITSVSWDPKFDGDAAVINGVYGHWQDPLQVKSTLSGKPFGIGLQGASCYISPVVAEFGKEGRERLDAGWLGSATEDGQEVVTLDYSISKEPKLIDLRSASAFLRGSCKRRWGALANRWGELSQEGFHDRFSLGQSLLWMGAFAVGVGLAFLIIKYGGGGAGGITEIAI